ncbi:MAG: dihydroxyacetone kinase subunit DhaK [Actinobacteria bacterium]|nr:dihydroxyacetone kinase subunit DhaK [Actinomycetota bacterium]
MKKMLNDPRRCIDECFEGFILSNSKLVKRIGKGTVVARIDAPIKGKVGIVIGGGGGHEPLFLEYIGAGMADVEVHGRFFAAPSADLILEGIDAADGNKGVILLYNNYAGDRLNFDMAQDIARSAGKRIETILIHDDIASAPKGKESERRGTTADMLVIKVCGAAAEALNSFDEVVRITEKAINNSRSLGVALSPPTIPETGKPTFTIEDDKIEFGMGLHGEAGIKKADLLSADEIATQIIDLLLYDMPLSRGDEVILLLNSYGSTTRMELYIVARKVHQIFANKGINIYATEVGEFCTTQEMAGCSVTLMKIDDELKRYYDMPAESPFYKKL